MLSASGCNSAGGGQNTEVRKTTHSEKCIATGGDSRVTIAVAQSSPGGLPGFLFILMAISYDPAGSRCKGPRHRVPTSPIVKLGAIIAPLGKYFSISQCRA